MSGDKIPGSSPALMVLDLMETGYTSDQPVIVYDRNLKEDILFEVDDCQVYVVDVYASDGSDGFGYVSNENNNGCLSEHIESALDFLHADGYYVARGATMNYTRGDGWMTDDDAELEITKIEVATIPDCAGIYYHPRLSVLLRRHLLRQLKLKLMHLWGMIEL